MNTTKPVRSCVTCEKELYGRRGKVYCSEKCKNLHHKIARIQTNDVQVHNKRIIRNYVILNGLFKANKKETLIHHNLLFEVGFDKHNFISVKNVKGKLIYSILEFEFEVLDGGMLRIKRKSKKRTYFIQFIRRWEKIFPDGEGLVLDEIVKKIQCKLYYYVDKAEDNITVTSFDIMGIT